MTCTKFWDFQVVIPQLSCLENNKSAWLDVVWSLVVLNKCTPEQIGSVLKDDFIEALGGKHLYSTLA